MSSWVDVPGVTVVAGRGRLPRSPDVVVQALSLLAEGAARGETRGAMAQRVERALRVERGRVEGLLDWLPRSRVAAWHEERLCLDPLTDLHDLALRYTAWFATQPVPADSVEMVRAHVTEVARLAAEGPRGLPVGIPVLPPPEAPADDDLPPEPRPMPVLGPLLERLDASFLERRLHVRASLLALLAGQHVLLLGPPGTAKSLLARTLCSAFAGAGYFEYLLSRFTHPDELFGPVSIPGLKEEDYRRLTGGFLPTASVAFLDEIFKANSAILNSLLTLINERVFHHGRHRDPVPLLGVVGASNELPDADGGLAALYDRFLVRLAVPPLATPEAFLAVATGEVQAPSVPAELQITAEQLRELRARAAEVVLPGPVRDALVQLWRAGQRLEWGVSDRRWRQATQLLQVAAAADGRAAVALVDLLLLEPVLAPTPDRGTEVRQALLDQLGTGGVPEHDLRAQWSLLSMDRVAPLPGEAGWRDPEGGAWGLRVDRRRRSLARFLGHHQRAVEALARDRATLDRSTERHLWIDRLPSQVLAKHIEAGRDLAHVLAQAEAYQRSLADPAAVARALVDRLPRPSKRMYGQGSVVRLQLPGVDVGITLTGEQEEPRAPRKDGLVQPTTDSFELPVLSPTPEQFLAWVDGAVPTEELTRGLPAWSGRNVATALGSVRRVLGGSAIPEPPPLRDP